MIYLLFADFTPWLAAGAAVAAVGVPLVIHLLFRKRYQVVPWAAIRFLLVAERRHKRRIDQWLLLILRAAALALLLFAMVASTAWAERLWQAIHPGATDTLANVPRTHHVIVLDASLSMTAKTDDGRTRWEVAIAQAENLIESCPRGDGLTVVWLGSSAQVIVPGPSNDPEKVRAELRKLRPTHGPADHTAVLTVVDDILKRSPYAYPRRQVTFFTDLQRASWANALPRTESSTTELWQRITARADVAIVDTARTDPDNLAIAELTLSDPMPLVDQPVTVTVTVVNFGRVEKKKVRVDLYLGRPSSGAEALAAVEQQELDPIPPGGRTSVKFELSGPNTFRDRGVHVIQARLASSDALPADDTRALAVEVREGLHMLLVDGKAHPDWDRRAATLLHHALYPPEAQPHLTPNRPRLVTPAEFVDPNIADLANVDGRGNAVDCVFFCDVLNPTADMAAKLEAVLRRGGTVVIGLGPNAAASRDQYNAVLYRDGHGILPAPLGEVVTAEPENFFRLAANDDDYRKPPLVFFNDDRIRPGLINVPFTSYIKLDLPEEGRGRRILTFTRTGQTETKPDANARPDAAIIEWYRHRGRVYVYTSTFNRDWTSWPALRSYLQFWHEFVRYSVANPDRHTVRVGEALEEFFPASAAGLTVGLNGPDGLSAEWPLLLQDEAGVARFSNTAISGLYRMGLGGSRDRVFAVNVAEIVPGTPSESDLRTIEANDFKSFSSLQIVPEAADIQPSSASGAVVTTKPKPHGPWIARMAVVLAVIILAAELLVAWRSGPARTGGMVPDTPLTTRRRLLRLVGNLAAGVPLMIGLLLLATIGHAESTGQPLGFLPHNVRMAIENAAGVPAAAPGEGTKWRLEGLTAFFRNAVTDRRVIVTLAGAAIALTVIIYALERRAVGGVSRVVLPLLLRSCTFLLALLVVLPQLRLAFDREGLPELVLLLDTSASMATVDDFRDPAVRQKARELAGPTDLAELTRLRLAQLLLLRPEADWLDKLLREKQVKVHIYTVDVQTRMLTLVEDESFIPDGRAAIASLQAEGDGSHLGDGIHAVLKAFRGSSLAGIVMFTDGVTTSGDDIPKAARAAALEGVPLYLIGVGDTWEPPDLALTDLQADDVVGRGDRLVLEARLTARGEVAPVPVTIFLKEKLPDGRIEDRGQTTVTPDRAGHPVNVSVAHTPMETGERTFILEVPAVPGETNVRNNRLERTVLVTDSRRIRVLYVEGYPRYDFRFVKVLLERESEKSIGGKSVEVQVVLLDASKGWAETDRSAFRGEFPTRTELFGFDVIILGDVDPKDIGGNRSTVILRDIVDFVKQKGGGLLFLSGQHGTPAAYIDTPLAEILPVVPSPPPATARSPEEQPLTEGYRPKLTPAGRLHPLFRFAADDNESARIWNQLPPLYWAATGYRRKPLTNVLAVHPHLPADGGARGENHPLVVQQFAGAGPVLFLGFDDTWRWRFRNNEEHFDRFWMQAMRVLARARIRRPELRVAPKAEFRRDEKITVQVRFPIEAPAPGGDSPVRVAVTRSPLLRPDGTPGPGMTEVGTLTLHRVAGPIVQFEGTLARVAEGEYRFELIDPDLTGTRPWATARVLPPLNERDRLEMNRADLIAAANDSGGRFYTLATAREFFDDLKNLERIPLNQPCPPVELWNQPAVYALLLILLMSEWLLRKRERLL
ncbi:MAG: VWA domain-containing protein [Gemmataceae bacterium]|nr:VWA domain-containing protein [Gemmata sp.]MDW8196809.1 VWA domain-containing protein [Gemmataceae bacterium]